MNKKAIAFILTGMVIGSSVTAFAAGGKKIEIFNNVKKIVINNVNKQFTSKNEPFTYNGTTYVPLRYISEALGENVDWDGKTGTVYIGDRGNISARYWGKDINHMSSNDNVLKYEYDATKVIKNNIGQEFTNYLKLYANGEKFVQFPLNGNYSTFSCNVAFSQDSRGYTKEVVEVKVLVDDKVAYKSNITSSDMPKNISVNLKGANKVKLLVNRVESSMASGGPEIIFGNGQFIK